MHWILATGPHMAVRVKWSNQTSSTRGMEFFFWVRGGLEHSSRGAYVRAWAPAAHDQHVARFDPGPAGQLAGR